MTVSPAPHGRSSWGRVFAGLAADALLIVWGIALLGIARAVMIAALHRHIGPDPTGWAIASVFLNGFRFDLRVATLAALPSIFVSLAAFRLKEGSFHRRLRVWLATLFGGVTAVLVAVDIAYFEEFGNQFDHFLFGLVFDDRTAIVRTVWNGYPVMSIALVIVVVAILVSRLARRVVTIQPLDWRRLDRLPNYANVVLLLLALVTIVCCARGSMGRRPAQIKVAAVTADEFLNKMVVNPFDTLAAAAADYIELRQTGGLDRFLHDGDVRAAAKRYFHTTADLPTIDAYAQRQAPGWTHPPRHVVLIVMESYSAWPTLPAYRALHLSDELVGLSAEGLAVTRFVPAGPGTMSSLGTLVTGLPDAGLPLSYERVARTPFPTSSVQIFRRLGYRTRFFYGGYLSWQRIGELAKAQGFDEVHGGGEIGNWLQGKEWGVDDEHLFEYARKRITDDVPSFDVILSVSNHPPFGVDLSARGEQIDQVPAELASHFDGSIDLNVLAHFRYADRHLGRFVRATSNALTSPLFAITGDHYGRKFPNAHPTVFERLAVPFVLYGPDVLSGRRIGDSVAGSHIDVIPTLTNLAAPAGFSYPAFGRDLLAPAAQEQAGLGCSAAVTADGIVDFGGGLATEGSMSTSKIEFLRRRYDDLHALGWWRARNGAALANAGPLSSATQPQHPTQPLSPFSAAFAEVGRRAAILARAALTIPGTQRSSGSVSRTPSPIPPRVFDCRAQNLISSPRFKDPCMLGWTCGIPMIAGHRGVGGRFGKVAPESTLSAIRAAIALGLDFVEVDPRPTADGVLVVLHDSTVDRTTSGRGKLDALTFSAVRKLRVTSDHLYGDFGCDRVPTFQEVLELSRGRISVLIDADKTDRVDLIVRAVNAADARDWVVFDSRHVSKINEALALDPRLSVMIRPMSVDAITSDFHATGRRPVIVQLERSFLRQGAPVVHALGARVLTNVFDEDVEASATGDRSGYLEAINHGADILQSDRPELILAIRSSPRP